MPGGLLRYAVCWFIDQHGYPDRSKTIYSVRAKALIAALYEVALVQNSFPDGEDVLVSRVQCDKWYPAPDFSCVVQVVERPSH